MKKIALAAALTGASLTAASAGTPVAPYVEPEIVVEEAASSSSAGLLIPLLLLLIIGVALAADTGGGGGNELVRVN